ncbi:protein toll-like [Bactrocera neohumeralis]|uniref:protein toll-like n=1 Tax=Bactrocera neohumeralis TaxID=98809 RepID=UPI0021663BD9|nr:protein toll-like [Bactrocera neohumeralis]
MTRVQLYTATIRALFLFALHCRLAHAVITYQQCADMHTQTLCVCNHVLDATMRIVCALSATIDNKSNNNNNQSATTLTIHIHRSEQVRVYCHGYENGSAESERLFEMLPSLPIGPDLMLLLVSGCNNTDVILRRFNIRHVRLLELSADTTMTSAKLTRQQIPKALLVDSLTLTAYTQLAADLFADYKQLRFLEIQTTQLDLPLTIFQPLTNLIGLTLKARIKQKAPLQLLRAQSRLLNTVLSDGALQSLATANFSHLTQLQSLHLPRNKLSYVPAHALAPLTELLRINLSENRLRALNATMFAQQLKLVAIDLSDNELQTLPMDLFTRTQRLQELRLSHNQLKQIPNTLFAPLNYLKVLYLNNNQLSSLQPDTFAHNDELQKLHLQYNRLEIAAPAMCTIFATLKNVAELFLSNNQLTQICEQPSGKNKGHIDMSHNQIEMLRAPGLVALACNWARVDLSYNALQSILLPTRLHSNKSLAALKCHSTLALNYNALHCDCHLLNFVLAKQAGFLSALTQLNTSNLYCGTPTQLRARPIDTLQAEELLCPVAAQYCPSKCRCWARTYDATLIVNCTQARLQTVPTLSTVLNTTLTAIELHLTDNIISTLPINSTVGYALVTRLYIAGNRLRVIEASQLPAQLKSLDVRHNNLTQLSNSFYTLLNASAILSEIYLSHNNWSCDCDAEQLLITAKVHHKRISDLDELTCADARYAKILELAFNDICPTDMSLLFVSISLLVAALTLAVVSALYFRYQLEFKVWLYAHNACLWCVTEHELDKDKPFDAFISYSHKDEHFVVHELLPGLEQGDLPFRVCTHERNWLAGAYIPEQIIESVEQSRRTIIVLSQHFIESPWARMEFRTAHQSALNERRTRIIIIMYGEVTHMDALDTELQAYLKMNTYLKWNDPWFWRKLRYAMPFKRRCALDETHAPRFVYSAMELKELDRRARAARKV